MDALHTSPLSPTQHSLQIVSQDQQAVEQIYGSDDSMTLMLFRTIHSSKEAVQKIVYQFKHFKEETSKALIAKSEESGRFEKELILSRAQTSELKIVHHNEKEASQKLIQSLQEDLNKKGKELSTSQESLSKNQADLHAAQGEVAALRAQLTQLRSTHQAELQALQNSVKALEASSNENARRLGETQTQLTTTTNNLNATHQQLAGVQAALADSNAQLAASKASYAGVHAALVQSHTALTTATHYQTVYYNTLLAIRNCCNTTRVKLRRAGSLYQRCNAQLATVGI